MADNYSALRAPVGNPYEGITNEDTAPPSLAEQYALTSPGEGEFVRGLRRGSAQLSASEFARQALNQELAGQPNQDALGNAQKIQQESAQMYAPAVGSLRDVHGIGDLGDFAAGQLGAGAPSMVPLLAGALLARGGSSTIGKLRGFAGAAIPSYLEDRGSAALEQYNDPAQAAKSAESRDRVASLRAAMNAGLMSLVPGHIATAEGSGVLRKMALDAGLQAGVGAGMTGIGSLAAHQLNPNAPTPSAWDYADAAGGGALVGGVFGGLHALHGMDVPELPNVGEKIRGLLPKRAPGEPLTQTGAPEEPTPSTPEERPGWSSLIDTLSDRVGPKTKSTVGAAANTVGDVASDLGAKAVDTYHNTLSRMNEAAKTAKDPGDFLTRVFGSAEDDQRLLGDDDPSLAGSTIGETEQNIRNRDAERQARAEEYSAIMLADPTVKPDVREKISSMQDMADPENQRYVIQQAVAHRASQRVAEAADNLVDLGKQVAGAVKDAASAAVDKVVRHSLADTTPDERFEHTKLVFDNLTDEAKASPQVRNQMGKIGAALASMAARAGELDADDVKRLPVLKSAMGIFKDPKAVAEKFTQLASGEKPENSFLSKALSIESAVDDAKRPESFLFHSLSPEATKMFPEGSKGLDHIAHFVDEAAAAHSGPARAAAVDRGLAQAFGSPEAARAVVDFYRSQIKNQLKIDLPEGVDEHGESVPAAHGLTETEPKPTVAHFFDNNEKLRPFHGGSRVKGALRPITQAAMDLRQRLRTQGVNARVKSQSFHDAITETGGDHKVELERLKKDVQTRMDEGVKGFAKEAGLSKEQAARTIARDQGPRGINHRRLFNQLEELKDQGVEALKNHEVIRVEHAPESESGATDDDLRAMRTLVKDPSAGDTRVKFQKTNGKTLTLSAESIWKTMATKLARRGETGDGENLRDYAKKLYAQGVSDILGRPDIKGMEDKPVQIDRRLNLWTKYPDSERARQARDLTRQTLKLSSEGLENLKSRLDEHVAKYEDHLDDDGARESMRDSIEQNIESIQNKLNAAKNSETGISDEPHPLAGNKPAQAVQRAKLNLFKDALRQMRDMDFQHQLDTGEEGKPPVEPIKHAPGFEERGPDRYAEQANHAADQKLHEARTQQAKTPEQSAAHSRGFATKLDNDNALSDVALKALDYAHKVNYKLLKTPGDILKYAATAKQAMEQGAALPFKDLSHLTALLDKAKGVTEEQKALLKSIQDGTALVLTKRESLESRRGGKPISAEEQEKIKQEIWKQRGKDVQVLFRRFIGAEGSGTWSTDRGKRMIELAINAVNPMGVAYHESMHDFFNTLGKGAEERQIKQDLINATSAPQVMTKLREYFANHKAALEQIENSPEERLAYAYQLYAEGHLNELGPTGKKWYNRLADFVRDLIGVVSDHKRVQGIFDAMLHGKLTEPNLVTSIIQDRGLETFDQKFQRLASPVYDVGRKLFVSATDRLHELNSPALSEVADKFLHTIGRDILAPDKTTGELKVSKENMQELPLLQRNQMYVNLYNERLRKAVANTTFAQRREALENLQAMKTPSSPLEVAIDKIFKDIYKYMKEERPGGIEPVMRLTSEGKWENLPKAMEHYFYRRWDKEEIENHADEFMSELQKEGGLSATAARGVYDAIVNSHDGNITLAENEHHLGYTPFSAAVNKRQLNFINESNASKFTKFMNKDLMGTMTSYINQAVHRKEYAHSFGNDGQWIRQKLDEARKQGLGADELAQAKKAIAGLEGTLGHNINPRVRELFSGIMAYQNMVLLPLTIFSNMNDMMGIAMRSGEIRDSGKAFMQFVDGLKRAFKGDAPSEAEEVARTLGVISDENSLSSINEMYAGMGMSQFAKSLNNKFFKYNGMELWNRNMRTAATQAGMRFITRNLDNKRYMEELGLDKKNVFQSPDGRLLITKDQIAEHLAATTPGMKNIDQVAQKAAEQVHSALFKFVDESVLRPNAAHRPVWGSDPHYSLIFHLKQYTYSFQNVMLKHVAREERNGNITPAMILSSYVPFAIAAGMVRGSIAGTLNSTHDLYNIITQSLDRSGIGGVYTFKGDAVGDVMRGKVPGTSFMGPSFDHLMTLLGGLSGRTSLHDVAMRSVPLGAAFRGRFE